MRLLIDSDSLCYRAGFVVNEEGQETLANWQLDQIIQGILADTNCEEYKLYISGSDNFRYSIYPEYKGNRAKMVRPRHLQSMREHLVVKYGADISCGIEADDVVGITQYQHRLMFDTPIAIGHIDKDIDMIPGMHYNYVKKEWYEKSELSAMRHFFWQLIMGDRTDNIPGYDGKMRNNPVPKFLQPHIDFINETDSYDEMLVHVFEMYSEDWNRMNLSAQCLWIWRKEDDHWTDWQNPSVTNELRSMADSGHEEDSTRLLLPSYDLEADVGDQSTLV